MRIALISCGKAKKSHPCPAKEMYTSGLFKSARGYAESHFDTWYILSAKYGLVNPEAVITPYEQSLKSMDRNSKLEWTNQVMRQVSELSVSDTYIELLAGSEYSEPIRPNLESLGHIVAEPLRGLGLGKRMRWLQVATKNDLARIYDAVHNLQQCGQFKRFSDLRPTDVPSRGVYLFFEPNELRSDTTTLRIVRVGTHGVSAGSSSTLWSRLKAHRGTQAGGNHRSSVFRLHVGRALIEKHDLSCPTWGIGQSAPRETLDSEIPVEQLVTAFMNDLYVAWVEIADQASKTSDRLYVEESLIALLSSQTIDSPSDAWLGHLSPKKDVVRSGLWNIRATNTTYDSGGIMLFDYLANIQRRHVVPPATTIGPRFRSEPKEEPWTLF